jgi:hypothetical protein
LECHFKIIVECSAGLIKAVPEKHKKFLQDLVWVHEEVFGKITWFECGNMLSNEGPFHDEIFYAYNSQLLLGKMMNFSLVFQQEVDTSDPEMSRTKLIAVHAGLEITKSVEEQLKVLYNRDVTFPRVEALSGRKNVWEIPIVSIFAACVLFQVC